VIGFASGQMPQIAPNHLLVKNIDVIGFYWGGYMRFGADHLVRQPGRLMEMYEAGRITPHIGATRPLAACAEALDLLRNRRRGRQGRRHDGQADAPHIPR
jgi:NADPH2:quinone reductase